MAGIGAAKSPKRVAVGMDVGIGRLIGRPSTSALAHRPAALSTPFRLKIIFMTGIVRRRSSWLRCLRSRRPNIEDESDGAYDASHGVTKRLWEMGDTVDVLQLKPITPSRAGGLKGNRHRRL
jgi:hypothetical protein